MSYLIRRNRNVLVSLANDGLIQQANTVEEPAAAQGRTLGRVPRRVGSFFVDLAQSSSQRRTARHTSICAVSLSFPRNKLCDMADWCSETQPLVFDLASGHVRAGFAGDDAPRAVFPTIIGTYI